VAWEHDADVKDEVGKLDGILIMNFD